MAASLVAHRAAAGAACGRAWRRSRGAAGGAGGARAAGSATPAWCAAPSAVAAPRSCSPARARSGRAWAASCTGRSRCSGTRWRRCARILDGLVELDGVPGLREVLFSPEGPPRRSCWTDAVRAGGAVRVGGGAVPAGRVVGRAARLRGWPLDRGAGGGARGRGVLAAGRVRARGGAGAADGGAAGGWRDGRGRGLRGGGAGVAGGARDAWRSRR